MSTTGLEISAAAPARPPIDGVLAAVARRQEQGFDAVWWADRLLHWFPTSIWQPDLVPQAAAQASPHVWMDPFALVAASASAADRLRFGVGVTDLVRRHPAALAQTALTLDHVTKGRFILGVGAGESLNLSPIGMANEHPVYPPAKEPLPHQNIDADFIEALGIADQTARWEELAKATAQGLRSPATVAR